MSAGLALRSSLNVYKFLRVHNGLFDKGELAPRGHLLFPLRVIRDAALARLPEPLPQYPESRHTFKALNLSAIRRRGPITVMSYPQ